MGILNPTQHLMGENPKVDNHFNTSQKIYCPGLVDWEINTNNNVNTAERATSQHTKGIKPFHHMREDFAGEAGTKASDHANPKSKANQDLTGDNGITIPKYCTLYPLISSFTI